MFFVMCVTTRCYTTLHLHQVLFRFRSDFLVFYARISYFKLLEFKEFNKTIIPFALVGHETVIANSVLRASLAIYHLISNARSWNNC